jgi:Domain of unknown function (DUF4145)
MSERLPQQEQALLDHLLESCALPGESADRARFRAQSECFDVLDRLEHDRYIVQDGGLYRVSVTALPYLASLKAQTICFTAEQLWASLRAHYKAHQFAQVRLRDLVGQAPEISQTDIRQALVYMLELSWSSGRSNDLLADSATVGASEVVLKHATFRGYLDTCASWYRGPDVRSVNGFLSLEPRASSLPDWVADLPEDIATLMRQALTAMESGIAQPAAIAFRTLLEMTGRHALQRDAGPFKKMLRELKDAGVISLDELGLLAEVVNAGNAAAHQGYAPDARSLKIMSGIVTPLVGRVFLSDLHKKYLLSKTPDRPPAG